MKLEDIKTITDIVQNIVSSVAIIVAGLWSYFVFVVGREHAANIRLDIEPQYRFDAQNLSNIVVQISVENVGKTKANRERCYIAVEEIQLKIPTHQPSRVDTALDLDQAGVYDVLDQHSLLEPGEKANEQVIISVKPEGIYKMGVYWIESNVTWSSIHVVVPSTIQERQYFSPGSKEED